MKTTIAKSHLAAVLFFALLIQSFAFIAVAQNKAVREETKNDDAAASEFMSGTDSKVAPDLIESSDEVFHGRRTDKLEKVIIQIRSAQLSDVESGNFTPPMNSAMLADDAENNREKGGIIVSDVAEAGGTVQKAFNNVGLITASLPLSKIRQLAEKDEVAYISPDLPVQSFQHVNTTTGYYIPGISDKGDSDPNTWLAGGVGHVAVIDSGIDTSHLLMKWGTTSKVKYSQDFTGEGTTGDPYGHGTHVASLLAGDNQINGGAYQGTASASNLINLRVLNGFGLGSSSNLVAALDWVVANKATWNIRVVNMSLGTMARDSYVNDPLCVAARRAVSLVDQHEDIPPRVEIGRHVAEFVDHRHDNAPVILP